MINSWWIVFAAITIAGAFGGLTRYYWERLDGNGDKGLWGFVVVGVAASFLVPLFLNTLSSNLIKEVQQDQSKLFVLIGFCLAAAIFSRQFIGSVSRKALEISKEARSIATEARKTAVEASSQSLSFAELFNLINDKKFEEALKEIEEILVHNSTLAKVWGWKAYCLKRVDNINGALAAAQKAVEVSGKQDCVLLYNLACYQCLCGMDPQSVTETLRRAVAAVEDALEKKQMKDDLQADEDFISIRSCPEFKSVVDSLT